MWEVLLFLWTVGAGLAVMSIAVYRRELGRLPFRVRFAELESSSVPLVLRQAQDEDNKRSPRGELVEPRGRGGRSKPSGSQPNAPTPRTVVIVSVKGAGPELPRLFDALMRQTYAPFRLCFVVETETDEAHGPLLRAHLQEPDRIQLIVAGLAMRGGQKAHNLLAALDRLALDDEIVVFADVDIVPEPSWLERLVQPLVSGHAAAVSGYRWLVPDDQRLASAFASALNSSIATLPRLARWNIAWGGSTAVRRQTIADIDLRTWWRGAISTDVQFTRAIWAKPGRIVAPRDLLVRSPVAYDWPMMFNFARRQYMQIRLHAPRHWLGAFAVVAGLFAGWPLALFGVAQGSWPAVAALVSVIVCDQARALIRRDIVRHLWGERGLAELRLPLLLDRFATPLCLGLHAAIIASAAVGREIRWAGVRYRFDGPRDVVVLERDQ